VVDITKQGTGRASVTVNGQTFPARMDSATKRWIVTTPAGDQFTTSPKLHSIGKLFGQPVTVNGGAPKAPRAPRASSAGPAFRRRRHRTHWSGGTPPATARSGPAFATPKPNRKDLLLVALASLEDVFAVKLAEQGITDDVRKSYERYKKLKALALGPTTSSAAVTEAFSALRMSVIEMLKLAV
jgi:hypothetical protein